MSILILQFNRWDEVFDEYVPNSLKHGIRLQRGASEDDSDKRRRVVAEAETHKDWSGFLRQVR